MVKNIVLVLFLSLSSLSLLSMTTQVADARFGSGSSFGSRGSRSVAPRSSSNAYSSGASRPYNTAPSQPSAPAPMNPMPGYGSPMGGGGGFMRGMMGGMAGGFLGSMLFRSMGYGGQMGGGGGGGIGLFEILLIGGLLFFGIRFVMARAAMSGGGPGAGPGMGYGSQPQDSNSFGGGRPDLRVVQSEPQQGYDHGVMDEDTVANSIRRYDGAFDMARFKDSRVDDFFRIQAAWAQRDLTLIRPLVTTEIASSLESELTGLKASGHINHIENVAVRQTQIMEAWQEQGKEYVTLRFYANLLDYTVDEKTGAVVEGDKNQPKKFEEYWTYLREVGRPDSPWLLTAIEQQS